jgi:hypothetical protein
MLDDIGVKYLFALKKHIQLLHRELGRDKCETCESLWLDMEHEEGQVSTVDIGQIKGAYQIPT